MFMFGIGALGQFLQTLVSVLRRDAFGILLDAVAAGLMVFAVFYLYRVRDQFVNSSS
jgi:hypothetical protein